MKKIQKIRKNQAAFTIIELLVVVSVIGLLASVILVNTTQARIKAKNARTVADVRQIQNAVELFYAENGYYPESISNPGWPEVSPADLALQLAPYTTSPIPPGMGFDGTRIGAKVFWFPTGSFLMDPPGAYYMYISLLNSPNDFTSNDGGANPRKYERFGGSYSQIIPGS